MALAGMDPLRYLTTRDEIERMVMEGIAERYREAMERRDRNLAVEIANAVGRVFGGKG